MAAHHEVESFLREFRVKMKVWGIVYADQRSKNKQTLFDLQITPNDRDRILETLAVEDYSEGPLPPPEPYTTDAWVFGTMIAQQEIYIKIAMGQDANSKVICISFHIAEHPVSYPFK